MMNPQLHSGSNKQEPADCSQFPEVDHVVVLKNNQAHQWEAFVDAHPQSTFFHRWGWKDLYEQVFGYSTYYLAAMIGTSIEGILPLVRVKSRLFADALISVPLGVYGGVVANHPKIEEALLAYAITLKDTLKVDYLELRHCHHPVQMGHQQDLYVTFKKPISSSDSENLKEIPRKQRAIIRKGLKADLHFEIEDHTLNFYPVYSESLRNLGTPVQHRRYYEALLKSFGHQAQVLTVFHQKQAIASVLSFYFKNEVLPFYGGSIPIARKFNANDYMYWQLMCHCAQNKIEYFDYGRSKKGTGSYRFKKHWGFEEQPLYYAYILGQAKEPPNFNPLNPKYRLMIQSWKKLPVCVSQQLGPWIAKGLG